MEKSKKNRGAKIAAAFVALTALTCCFVGTTFAKYTSKVDGSGAATVAHWEINGISANAQQVYTFTTDKKLSPETTETSGSYVNKITQDYVITNLSDVDATIEWSIKDAIITWVAEPGADGKLEGVTYNSYPVSHVKGEPNVDGETGNFTGLVYTKDNVMYKVLAESDITDTISVEITATKDSSTATSPAELKAATESTPAGTMTITITATWTTQSDDIDTLIGMYVKSVGKKLTVTATQNSKLPV